MELTKRRESPAKLLWFFLTLIFSLLVSLVGTGIHLRFVIWRDRRKRVPAEERRAHASAIALFWSDLTLALIGCLLRFRVEYRLPSPAERPWAAVVIANHRSDLDIFLLLATLKRLGYRRVRFVAKSEVRKIPVIGRIAQEMGCAFIDRRGGKKDLTTVRDAAVAAGEDAACFAFFPEGTTYGDARGRRPKSRVEYESVLAPHPGGVEESHEALPLYPFLLTAFDWHGIVAPNWYDLYKIIGEHLVVTARQLHIPPGQPTKDWLVETWQQLDRDLSHPPR